MRVSSNARLDGTVIGYPKNESNGNSCRYDWKHERKRDQDARA